MTTKVKASVIDPAYSEFSSNTRITFHQATAPTNWTQDTTVNDYGLRVVSGVGGGITAGNNFTSVFASQAISGNVAISTATGTVAGTALTTAQLPAHNHTASVSDPGHSHGVNDPTHTHGINGYINTNAGGAGDSYGTAHDESGSIAAAYTGISIQSRATGISVTTANAGSGSTHTHELTINPQTGSFTGNNLNLSVAYIDLIVCKKN